MTSGAARKPSATTRVLIVDDSPFMRRALERLLEAMPGVEVAGTARNGVEAVQAALKLRPSVITMDVEMPQMDGVSAVREIMQAIPTPIVMVSTLTHEGADTTVRALEAGAVEYVAKPSALSTELPSLKDQLHGAIERAGAARLHRRPAARPQAPVGQRPQPGRGPARRVIVIGSSTGGPPALTEVVGHLRPQPDVGVLIVQHMPAGFTAALSRRLDALSPQPVREATEGDTVAAGMVLVAPGDYHMVVGSDHRIRLTKDAAIHGVRPAVDVTLASVAETYGRNATVGILTGMGHDGADGCVAIDRAGGRVVVQDEETCVVYGMPRSAKELVPHATEAPLERIADAVMRLAAKHRG